METLDEPLADRTLAWVDGAVETVDQTDLPHRYRRLRITTVDELIDAIQRLAIRGAPALGLAGAFGVALSAHRHRDGDPQRVYDDARRLAAARPTAVNLARGVESALREVVHGPDAVLKHAIELADADVRTNREAAVRAADLLAEIGPQRPLRLLTHCHTGRLATGGRGTALEAAVELAARGRLESVLATETRPLLQGARLTTWELRAAGVPHRLCVDSAAPAAMAAGLVDCVVVGADRIAANGDVANKIGTYALAVAAARHGIPFVVVAPESTVDPQTPDGRAIVIEQRPPEEVTSLAATPIAAPGTAAFNPAFDVTPTNLVTAVVTESRVLPGGRPARSRTEATAAGELAGLSRELYQRGWLPGTSGNLSVRLSADEVLITASGRDKGELTAADTVRVGVGSGQPVTPGAPRPSAETSIHLAIYRRFGECGAVVHAHSPYATALASRQARAGQRVVRFDGYELAAGLGRRDGLAVPVFTNWSDVSRIAADADAWFESRPEHGGPALLIAYHGVTVWGTDLRQARNHLECVEELCRLALLLPR
ncbi:S-methyl-5-thioribose-1-phosphate isomerase [Dactylosporangium sp. NPDC000555]|uniref:S-methyl-5-thioribose-1-phosphate isomerase n=1 Tax=Dactylosporangium sp. NPDC000555 TaxID=3154260 RepID=UPI0033347173